MTSISQTEQADRGLDSGDQAPSERVSVLTTAPISYLSLFLFYLPLGFSGLMMTLDLPIVNAVLNRFPNPDTSVAALRVAFSLALVYEASHICMIDLSTALSTDQRVFYLLRRFYIVLAGVLLVVASIIAFSPAYDYIVRGVMNIPLSVSEAARPAVWAFLLWPIPIGWRRLCQGALIRHGHPKPVGAGGIVRLGALVVALVFFGWLGTNVLPLQPSAIAVLAMLVSVTAESAAVQGWTSRVLRSMPEDTAGKPAPTLRDIWHFFFPLSGTAIMSTLVQPVLTAGIASAAIAWASPNGSVVAVASYAVAWSVAFLVFGPTLSMTQASIAWHGSDNPQVRERGPRVILGVGVALGLLMVLAALSGFARWLFTTVIQAPPETAAMAVDVTYWLIPMPILHATSFMLRGKLIALHEPRIVRRSQFIDLVFLMMLVGSATTPFVASLLHGVPAAPLAAVGYNLMLVVDITVLSTSLRRKRSIDQDPRHKEHV
jgi:hypothetical protein